MATWPSELPQEFEEDGYSEVQMENTIRTNVTFGAPKVRRRFTAVATEISGTLIMTAAQLLTFDTFFSTTLADGSLSFTWAHPRTGVSASFRFKEPPSKNSSGMGYYKLSCKMEKLP